jgi:hypothetical protein
MEINVVPERYFARQKQPMKHNVETLTKLSEINAFLIVLNIWVAAERPEYGENERDNHQKTQH